MYEKLHVLRAATQLGSFTVADLVAETGLKEATVRTAIARQPRHWFDETTVMTGARGGQHIKKTLTEEGRRGITAILGKVNSFWGAPREDNAPSPVLTPSPDAVGDLPLGLLAATDALSKAEQNPALSRALVDQALGNLEWAESEVHAQDYSGDLNAVLAEVSRLRAEVAERYGMSEATGDRLERFPVAEEAEDRTERSLSSLWAELQGSGEDDPIGDHATRDQGGRGWYGAHLEQQRSGWSGLGERSGDSTERFGDIGDAVRTPYERGSSMGGVARAGHERRGSIGGAVRAEITKFLAVMAATEATAGQGRRQTQALHHFNGKVLRELRRLVIEAFGDRADEIIDQKRSSNRWASLQASYGSATGAASGSVGVSSGALGAATGSLSGSGRAIATGSGVVGKGKAASSGTASGAGEVGRARPV